MTDRKDKRFNFSVSGNEKKYNPKINYKVQDSWGLDLHNPEHDHPSDADTGLSCIMYLTYCVNACGDGSEKSTSLFWCIWFG